jgi:hypothetical protein
MKLKHSLFITALTAAAFAQPTFANLVTSIPGGTVLALPGINYFGPGPITVAPGVVWSSTNASNQGGSVYGYTGTYGYGGNGYWSGLLGPMAGVNDSTDAYGVTDTMSFSFASPVSAVGGFLNYLPGSQNATTIAVWDGANLIESANLTFLTGGGTDEGEFLGFSESTPDITGFTLTDNYIGITDLTVSGLSVVPETPSVSVIALAFAALAAFGWSSKRRAVQA